MGAVGDEIQGDAMVTARMILGRKYLKGGPYCELSFKAF